MSTRTVRLDQDTDRVLAELAHRTGLSISGVLREGVLAFQRQQAARPERSAYEIYRELDLGPGGDAIGPSTDSRNAVREALRRKHGRFDQDLHPGPNRLLDLPRPAWASEPALRDPRQLIKP